jgi:putative oxidoreductase
MNFSKLILRRGAPKSDLGGWVLRGGVAAYMVVMGAEKFVTGPADPWLVIFQQIGLGDWFRYFTGAVEVVGGILYFFPMTCLIGMLILGCTMIGAMLVHILIRHSIGDSVFPGIILVIVVAIAMRQPEPTAPRVVRR